MKKNGVSRRRFVRLSALGLGAFSLGPLNLLAMSNSENSQSKNHSSGKMIFPRAFAFAIDDLGWNIGNDDGDIDGVGPYRIGVKRKMGLKDYQGIVEVGEAVGTRVQCLFILSEMDRENILRKHPTTTYQGAAWDNSKNVMDEQIDIMNYVQKNAAYMEFGLHGVGHEFWVDGKKNRAEWYSQQDDHPWTEADNLEHLQCFKDIMAQYGWTKENGQSFPESFVPCAYGYYWNPAGQYSTGKVMAAEGVKYVNTLFEYIPELNPPKGANGGGFDNGVVVINRINYGNEWYQLGALPTESLDEQETDIIETHWSNWLAQDEFLQQDVNERFIEYYKMVQQHPDRYVAKNTEQLHAQWLYNKYAVVAEPVAGKVTIDNTKMPLEAYENNILGTMVLKIKLNSNQHISKAQLDGKAMGVYHESEGFGILYLPVLEPKKYTLTYELGSQKMPVSLTYDGTYNVYEFDALPDRARAKVRVYGTQVLVFEGVSEPHEILVDNTDLSIIDSRYEQEAKKCILTVQAKDMQGETGVIELS